MEVLHSRENTIRFFHSYVDANKNKLAEKCIYDLSAGTGYIADIFYRAGASVKLYDLFPEQMVYAHLKCDWINLDIHFPIEDNIADVVLLSETIECLPNQLLFFQEASRILRPGGVLILTTPNPSSLRSRFSQFLMESEHYSRPLADESDAYTTWPGADKGYFAKIFLSGVLRIRLLAALQGLMIKKIHKTPYSSTSIFLLIFYPFIYFFSLRNLKSRERESPEHKDIFRNIFEINTSLKVLLSKHLVVEFIKK